MTQLQLHYDALQLLGGKSTLLFLATGEGEGATTAAVSTANSMCKAGAANVLLVEVDFSRPCLARLFRLPESPGLIDLLTGSEDDLDKVIRLGRDMSRPQPFDVVPAGRSLNGNVMQVEDFRQILQRFRQRYDIILLDACPLQSGPWLRGIMPMVDGVLLVVACERTRWEVAQHLCAQLKELGAPIAGVLLNRRRYYVPKFLYRTFRRTGG